MIRSLRRIGGLLLGIYLFFMLLLAPGILVLPFTLVTGWWPASARLYKAMDLTLGPVISVILAASILIAGSHFFLRWLYPKLRTGEAKERPLDWPWKWTFTGFGILCCTLLAIGSLILTTHQLYWMSRSTDPLFIDPFRDRMIFFHAAAKLQQAAEEVQWDGPKTREAFWTSIPPEYPAWESIQPVWIEHGDHELRAIVLVPRRPLERKMARLTIVRRGTNTLTRDLDELNDVLASFGLGPHYGDPSQPP